MTVAQIAGELGVTTTVVRRFARKHKILPQKVLGQREKVFNARLYVERLRAEGYGEEADRLEAWLVKRREGELAAG
jgi:hypothetical protein